MFVKKIKSLLSKNFTFSLLFSSLITFTLCLLLYKINRVPDNWFFDMAINSPLKKIGGDHTQGSRLMSWIAYYLNFNDSYFSYLIYCLSLILIGIYFCFFYIKKNNIPLSFGLLLALSPIMFILFSWVGIVDAMTFLLTALLLNVRSPIKILAISFFGGITHGEQFCIILPQILFFRAFLLSKKSSVAIKQFNFGLIFICVLIIVLSNQILIYLITNQIFHSERLNVFLLLGDQIFMKFFWWLEHNKTYVFYSLYSFFQYFLPLLILTLVLSRKFWKKNLIFLSIIACNIFIAFLTKDITRVFSLITWPIIFLYVCEQSSLIVQKKWLYRLTIAMCCVLIYFVKPYYLWEKRIYVSPTFHQSYSFFKKAINISTHKGKSPGFINKTRSHSILK